MATVPETSGSPLRALPHHPGTIIDRFSHFMITRTDTRSTPYVHLAAMMFLEFFVLGSTIPIFSLYLKHDLGFSGTNIGIILACSAVSSLISPFISALIADRLISAERLLSLFHAAGAIVLLALFCSTGFIPVLILYLLYWLLIGPTVALTTAITFHHAPQAVKQFGGIRLWGTLGWIGAAWVYRFVFRSPDNGNLHHALQMGMCGSVALAIFALSIPRGVVHREKVVTLLPVDSLKIILHPQILLLCGTAVIISAVDRMYIYGAAPYLKSLGVQEQNIMPMLSIGQIPEVFGLALLGFFIVRFGIKRALLVGASLEILRFFLLSRTVTGWALTGAISVHGLTYAFYFVAASILLDTRSTRETRSGAHQYFALFSGGLGNLLGNVGGGLLYDKTGVSFNNPESFSFFWTTAMVLSVVGFGTLLLFFRDKHPDHAPLHQSSA